ncbi:MAG: hypothetical protein K2J42_05995 [Muribaculaceae bacterium]|nr:hypothetical protein [Muribaculaceae bacterium]MDE6809622.1 hypothetical protein [Muribaculaceae bacterium]
MNQTTTISKMWMGVMTAGMLLIVAGTVLPIFRLDNNIYKYVYTAGAVMLLVSRLFNPYKGTNLRLKRLVRIESWSAIFFCVAAFFMFYDPTTARDWLAFTLAGGIIQIYTSIMIPRVEAKSRKENNRDQ